MDVDYCPDAGCLRVARPSPDVPPPPGGYPEPGATPLGGYPAPDVTSTAAPATATPGPRVFVTYKDFEIVPAVMTITAGTMVVFLIESDSGARHQPYSDDPPNVFKALADLGNGAQFSHTFTEPGTVTLRCRYHDTMMATLTITP